MVLSGGYASPLLDDSFDARNFTSAEIRILQRSLTFLGYYGGLWDKLWGPASENALEAYALDLTGTNEVTNLAAVGAILQAIEFADRVEWKEYPLQSLGISFGVPEAYVQFRENPSALEFVGTDLSVRLWTGSALQVRQEHLRRERLGGANTTYLVRQSYRLVTSYILGDTLVYLRSDLVRGSWITLEVEGVEDVREPFSYVTSSFDTSSDFEIADEDLVNVVSLIEQVAELADEPGSDVPTDSAPLANWLRNWFLRDAGVGGDECSRC